MTELIIEYQPSNFFEMHYSTTLNTIQKLLLNLTQSEKAQVLQWVAQDLGNAFPNIEKTPNINGGEATIVRTRIPIWGLVEAKKEGSTEADILRAFPSLRVEDLASAWAYYRMNASEIDEQIQAQNEA